ncbi:MAG: hypothetical protein RLZZ627_726 [Pseudomonadota bacterium]
MTAPDPFLLGLFREEMAAHSAVLTDGLLAMERGGGGLTSQSTEPLMRAAHSLKGAARVVDLGEVSRVAHRMEDVFVAMGEGRMAVSPDLVDHLLGALDWMVSVGDVPDEELEAWISAHTAEADTWESRLAGWLPATSTGQAQPLLDDLEPPGPDAEEVEALPPADVPDPGAHAPEPQSLGAESGGSERASDPEASVRISAENLSQMLAHSADLLLEARRLDALARNARFTTRRVRAVAASQGGATDAGGNGVIKEELTELGHLLESEDEHLIQLSSRLNFLSERLHALVLRGRLRPFSEGVQGFPRLVRDLARDLGKSVDFSILGGATLIDRDILNRLDAPLNHLLRNALDHGIETPAQRESLGKSPVGKLSLEARHLNGRLLITLTDDGGGIDCERLRDKIIQRGLVNPEMSGRLTEQELFAFLFLPGITTRETVSQISGRGVGLDVVQTMIHGCGGSIRVSSEPHLGTRFECQLPVTRSVVRCLRIEVDGHGYAFPLSRIHRAERIATTRVESMESMRFFRGDEGHVALFSARALMGLEKIEDPSRDLALVLFELEGRRYALEVDRLVGEMDLVVRPLDPRLGKVAHFSTVSIDSEGRPILIADVDDLIRTFDRLAGKEIGARMPQQQERGAENLRILVVDDSLTVREVERKLLQDAGYVVETAVDGVDGWNQLAKGRFALLVTDVDMPRMNGIELVTRIKADERFCDLPIVIVSYKDREEDRQMGLSAGADYYLTKGSVHDKGLLAAVRDLIGSPEDA